MHQITTGLAHGLDNRLEPLGEGLRVDFQQYNSLARRTIAQQALDTGCKVCYTDPPPVQVQLVLLIDQHTHNRMAGAPRIPGPCRIPVQMAVIVGPGEDHEEYEQVERDITHGHAGNSSAHLTAFDIHK